MVAVNLKYKLHGFVEIVLKVERRDICFVWFGLNVCQSRGTFSVTGRAGVLRAGARCLSPALAASTCSSFASYRVIFSKLILLPRRERQCELQLEARVSFPWEIKSPQCWHGLSGYYWSNPGWAITTARRKRQRDRERQRFLRLSSLCVSVLLNFQSQFK